MILSVFAPVTWKSFVMVGIIIGAVGLTMGYSYIAYKKRNRGLIKKLWGREDEKDT